MAKSGMIEITRKLAIPEGELRFTFSRSGGPGGQNVNKVSTKATLRFDVSASKALNPEQKAAVKKRLASRISRNGVLVISSDRHRSQHANRREAVQIFQRLLKDALKTRPQRKRTTISRAAKERRLKEKRHRSRIKQMRSKSFLHDS